MEVITELFVFEIVIITQVVTMITTVTAAIPEYPLGLLVLLIFMVATYAYFKRRVARKHNNLG